MFLFWDIAPYSIVSSRPRNQFLSTSIFLPIGSCGLVYISCTLLLQLPRTRRFLIRVLYLLHPRHATTNSHFPPPSFPPSSCSSSYDKGPVSRYGRITQASCTCFSGP